MRTLALIVAFLLPAAAARAGWQRDMVCQGSCGGGCGACPTFRERGESAAERAAEREAEMRAEAEARARRLREARHRQNRATYQLRVAFTADQLSGVSKDIDSQLAHTETLAPSGDLLLSQSEPSPFPERILAGKVGGIKTPASALSTEALRRGGALLAAAASGGLSGEDRAYLAQQAALAMDGSPLAVVVPDTGAGAPSLDAEKTREQVAAAQELDAAKNETDAAVASRIKTEFELANVKSDLAAGRGDAAALAREKDRLSSAYQDAMKAEASAQTKEAAVAKKVTIIVEP